MAREKAISHFRPGDEASRPPGLFKNGVIDRRIGINGRLLGQIHFPINQESGIGFWRNAQAIRQGLQLLGVLGADMNVEAVGHGRRVPLMADGVKSSTGSVAPGRRPGR